MSAIKLKCPAAPSDTGAYKLSWSGPAGVGTFRLEENGKVLYQGPHRATTVSGRGKGAYRYRVGTVASNQAVAWTDSCVVQVQPPSLQLALLLLGVGFVVFVSTTILIIRGHRAHRGQRA